MTQLYEPQGQHPNGTWSHQINSVLVMTLTYEQAVALKVTLAEAQYKSIVAPSYVDPIGRILGFLTERTSVIRKVVEEKT